MESSFLAGEDQYSIHVSLSMSKSSTIVTREMFTLMISTGHRVGTSIPNCSRESINSCTGDRLDSSAHLTVFA